MDENLQGDDFLMAERVWEPVTPAKPAPVTPGSASIKNDGDAENFRQNVDLALNSKEGFADSKNSALWVELGDHERSGVNGNLFDTEAWKSIEENSGNQNFSEEMGERLDISDTQKLLGVNANSENQSSNGVDCLDSLSPQDRDGRSTDTALNGGGDTSQPQNLERQKRMTVKRRPKMKRHRPKIYDVMKPKKVPKSRKPKVVKKRKRKDTEKPKSEKNVKRPRRLKSGNATQDTSCVTDPQTPEPSVPNRVTSSIGSCRDLSNYGEPAAPDSWSTLSCKRALDFDLDAGFGGSVMQDEKFVPRRMDFDLNLDVQDFEFCIELRKIVWEVKNIPVMSQGKRMRRRRATTYPFFSDTKEYLREMLPTFNQFSAAMMDPKSFRCVLCLKPIFLTRKKRSKRAVAIAAGIQSKCVSALSTTSFPRKKRSQINRRRNVLLNINEIGRSLKSPLIDLNTLPPFEGGAAGTLPPSEGASDHQSDGGASSVENHSALGAENHFENRQSDGGALGVESFVTTLVESSEVEIQNIRVQKCIPSEDMTHNVRTQNGKKISDKKEGKNGKSNLKSNLKRMVNSLIKKLEHLSISDNGKSGALVLSKRKTQIQKSGALVLSKGKNKPKKLLPEVVPDVDIMNYWMQLKEDRGEKSEEEYWKKQKELFCGRVEEFIKCMHLIQGNRRFSRWKGSVVDSFIGVLLTQNVTDNMSSDAFMRFVARFPKHGDSSKTDFSQKSVENITFFQEFIGDGSQGFVVEDITDTQKSGREDRKIERDEVINENDLRFSQESVGSNIEHSCDLQGEGISGSLEAKEEVFSSKRKNTSSNSSKKDEKIQINWDDLRKEHDNVPKDTAGDTDDAVDWEAVRVASTKEIIKTIGKRGMYNVLAEKIQSFLNRLIKDHGKIDLEWLRYVDTEKVREYLLSFDRIGLKSLDCIRLLTLHHHAFPVDTNVARIVVRLGWVPLKPLPDNLQMHLLNDYPMLASIQEYLWPRLKALDQPTLYELHYQMITFGKVFCTKVKPRCDICPMRRSCKHFASLQSARLCLPSPPDQGHNCHEHSERHPIPSPREKQNGDFDKKHYDECINQFYISSTQDRRFTAPLEEEGSPVDENLSSIHESQSCVPIIELPVSPSIHKSRSCAPIVEMSASPKSSPFHEYQSCCDPIIEMPVSPEPESNSWEIPEIDIEDLTWDSKKSFEDELDELFLDLTKIERESNIASKELAILDPEAASVPPLRTNRRLHREREVYVLPDHHCLLAQFRKREIDDPGHYLLAVWTDDETTDIGKQDNETVLGTILIPCRTATQGRFALNGTYFQVNEVFADFETSKNPIRVLRELLWNLPMRRIYCATTGRSIFRDMSLMEIHNCFWKGYICVRSFNRETGEPLPLHNRIFPDKTKAADKAPGNTKKSVDKPPKRKAESKSKRKTAKYGEVTLGETSQPSESKTKSKTPNDGEERQGETSKDTEEPKKIEDTVSF